MIPMLVFHFTIDVCAVILGVIYIVQDFPHLLQSFGHLVLLTRKSLYSNPRTSVDIVWFCAQDFSSVIREMSFMDKVLGLSSLLTEQCSTSSQNKQTEALTSSLCIFSAIRWILELLPCIHKWPSWDMAGAARFLNISSYLTLVWKWTIDVHQSRLRAWGRSCS